MTDAILARYPKARPPLPEEYQQIYKDQYAQNRNGETAASSLAQRVESWLHKQVAEDADPAKSTLELGAGTLNQLEFEETGPVYDIVEPMSFLYEGSRNLPRVSNAYASIHEVPADARYDRITSCAVLEHVCDLPEVVLRAGQLLVPGGVFRASIPSEGGALWKLGWMATTGLEFRLRTKLDYGVLIAHEHVSTASEIEAVVKHFFRDVKVKSFGIGRQLSLYRFIEARDPVGAAS